MMLPCLSRVWQNEDSIYFFIQMQQPYLVFYAVATQIGDDWKVDYV